MTENKGIMLVVSGPAGSGKGTVNAMLLKRDDFAFSVSATTRAARPGEVDGVNYHFITRESFLERIDSGDMLEYTEYCGNFYGTPLKEAEEVLRSGKNLILEIEVEGAMNVKRKYPDAVLVLLLPPSYSVQEARLRGRGTETDDVIEGRLRIAENEMKACLMYDYIVINREGCAEECSKDIISAVKADGMKACNMYSSVSDFFN